MACASPGTDVVAVPCDITDPAAVAAAAAAHADGGASIFIHAAGSAVLAPSDRLTADDFRTTFAAKVVGLETMLTGWPLSTNCRIVLCSSTAAYGEVTATPRTQHPTACSTRSRNSLRTEGSQRGLGEVRTLAGRRNPRRRRDERALRSGLSQMPPELAAAAVLSERGRRPPDFRGRPGPAADVPRKPVDTYRSHRDDCPPTPTRSRTEARTTSCAPNWRPPSNSVTPGSTSVQHS